jgi:uracil-DNA glycosylase
MAIKIHPSWGDILKSEFDKPYFLELVAKVKSLYQQYPNKIFPKGAEIFAAFDACPWDDVRVVILGQDPYPTRGHAHGLCFSVVESVRPIPKSLQNIFKEIQNDCGIPFPENGNLTRWASQGIFLLNSVLTVEEGKADSHKGIGWEIFTDEVIKVINKEKEGVVFMLWGAKAISKAETIDKEKHLVLTSVHPSPLSSHRGFFGCKHFSKANEFLSMIEKPEIKW